MNAVLGSMPKSQVARRCTLIAACDHPAAVKRGDTERVDGFVRRPVQKFRARSSDAECTANRARPPAVGKKLWCIDAEPDTDYGFVADHSGLEKSPPGSTIFLRHSDQRRHDHRADTSSRARVNIVHLAAVSRNGHRLHDIQKGHLP